jgi:hypothetical protein
VRPGASLDGGVQTRTASVRRTFYLVLQVNMPLLFSYGTLQHLEVQLSTFGRLLAGEADDLVGFEPSLVRIEDPGVAAVLGRAHYANVVFTGRTDTRVSGTAFEVTDGELSAADEYERAAAYTRVAVTLASGREAWVYLRP